MWRRQAAPWAGFWQGAFWPVLAGLAQAASLALPGSGEPAWGLQLAAMAMLAWLLHRAKTPGQGGWIGFVFAWAWLVGTFWWLFISMHTYGGLAAPLAVLAVLALAAFLASYYGVVSWLFCRLSPENTTVRALFFGAIWTLAELARARVDCAVAGVRLREVGGVAGQRFLDRGLGREMRGEEVKNYRPFGIVHRAHQPLHPLRVDLPVITLAVEQLQ